MLKSQLTEIWHLILWNSIEQFLSNTPYRIGLMLECGLAWTFYFYEFSQGPGTQKAV